jgi:hypothetical protein
VNVGIENAWNMNALGQMQALSLASSQQEQAEGSGSRSISSKA